MRLSRARVLVVLLLAVLHVGSGVALAAGACCANEVHAPGTPRMECCLEGGPNHICPFMSKRARSKAPLGTMEASCAAGHDEGMPLTGFPGLPQDPAGSDFPLILSSPFDAIADQAIAHVIYPPTPPPKHLL